MSLHLDSSTLNTPARGGLQVGSILERPLGEILNSDQLGKTRADIALATRRDDAVVYASCGPNGPNCYPACDPMRQCNPCAPHNGQKCQPNDWCPPAK